MNKDNNNIGEKIRIEDAEIVAATEEAKDNIGHYEHKFSPPFTYEGKTFETLVFDFDQLTGRDDLAIEAELQALGKPVIVAEMSGPYLVRVAAKCCNETIGVDAIEAMPLKDFRAIRNKARSFLLRSGS